MIRLLAAIMRRVLDSLVMLRLIDRYLIREIVPYLLLSLLLLTAIIFFHEASRFAELLVVASRNGLPMQALSRLLTALIPGILVFTLPISLLMGVLVGMGRMSGDSEIVALGASGLPPTSNPNTLSMRSRICSTRWRASLASTRLRCDARTISTRRLLPTTTSW